MSAEGDYILFYKEEVEVALVKNRGEVKMEQKADFQFYLWVLIGDDEELEAFNSALSKAGLDCGWGNHF